MNVQIPIYAHIFNRGVDKRTIFKSDRDRNRFMLTMRIALLEKGERVSFILRKREKELLTSMKQKHLLSLYGPPLLEIISFCLMPNHFHICVKAPRKENITKFAQRLGNSYTLYFNKKYARKGRLFESSYKTVPIKTDEQLIHLVRYIHTNPANSIKRALSALQLKSYLWSSLPAYLKNSSEMCVIDQVLSFFKDTNDFWEFTKAGIKLKEEKLSNDLLID